MTKLTEKQESLLNELLEDFQGNIEVVMGPKGLMNQLRKCVVEAMLDGEMTSHLGYAPHDPAGNGSGNFRNGHTAKKVQSKDGELALEIPRDRNGSFEHRILRKGQRRMDNVLRLVPASSVRSCGKSANRGARLSSESCLCQSARTMMTEPNGQ